MAFASIKNPDELQDIEIQGGNSNNTFLKGMSLKYFCWWIFFSRVLLSYNRILAEVR